MIFKYFHSNYKTTTVLLILLLVNNSNLLLWLLILLKYVQFPIHLFPCLCYKQCKAQFIQFWSLYHPENVEKLCWIHTPQSSWRMQTHNMDMLIRWTSHIDHVAKGELRIVLRNKVWLILCGRNLLWTEIRHKCREFWTLQWIFLLCFPSFFLQRGRF